MNKWTIEELKEMVEPLGCKLINAVFSNQKWKLFLIGTCGHEYNIFLNNFKNSGYHVCDSCRKEFQYNEKDFLMNMCTIILDQLDAP